LTGRRDKRKQAYQYTAQAIDVASVISLAELDKLKSGYADPSRELVIGLKTSLHHVASERETEEYLVKPFLSKSRLSKQVTSAIAFEP